jgi:MFS family permease
MGFAPNLAWLFAGRALTGIAGAIYAPANAFVADVTPPEKRAQSFGLIGAAFGLGFILGPALGGLLGESGPRAPFFAAAILAGINFVYGCVVLPESLPKERRRPFSLARANPLGTLRAFRGHKAVLGLALAAFFWQLAFHVYPATWSFFAMAKFASARRARRRSAFAPASRSSSPTPSQRKAGSCIRSSRSVGCRAWPCLRSTRSCRSSSGPNARASCKAGWPA